MVMLLTFLFSHFHKVLIAFIIFRTKCVLGTLHRFFKLFLWLSSKEPACQCRRHGFNPCIGKSSLEEEMATHSSILACRIPWTKEAGGLQSMGLQSIGHDLVTKQQQ